MRFYRSPLDMRPVQPVSVPPALTICAKHIVRHREYEAHLAKMRAEARVKARRMWERRGLRATPSPHLPIAMVLVLVFPHYGAVFAVDYSVFAADVGCHACSHSPQSSNLTRCLGGHSAPPQKTSFYWANRWFGWCWSATAALAATVAALQFVATPGWVWYAAMT
jgi:hypothetical protein